MGTLRRQWLCCLIILLLSNNVKGQEEVPWSANFRLRWKDFKGDVPKGAWAAATTASGIGYSFSTHFKNRKMIVDYEVNSYFYPTRSWYQPDLCNEVTLGHEQIHFDITELFSRKMNEEISNTKFTNNIKEEVRAIYKRTLMALDSFQKEYDKQTNFSRNIEKQKLWQIQISALLHDNQ